jgi:hypothetical protein
MNDMTRDLLRAAGGLSFLFFVVVLWLVLFFWPF